MTTTVKKRLSEQDRTVIRRPRNGQRALFDAADTTRLNQQHWSHAAGGDFDTLLRMDSETLRRRARYEILNNGYGSGIADTLAFDIVGTGPRPQADSGNEAFDQEIEERFQIWAQRCDWGGQMDLAEFLQMQVALQPCEAGESLTVFKRDKLVKRGVALRLLAIDIDRLATPLATAGHSARLHDGIAFDADGRPTGYHILKDHPYGGYCASGIFGDADVVPASQVVHLYRVKRPGQSRGIPWFAPALELFAQMRRFTLATLDAAETAADIAGTLEAEGLEPDGDWQTNDVLELERKALLMVPPGYRMNQVKPEHPSATYQMFKNEIINEIARCVLMPFNVAAANSARYNYASGRLDHQKYHRFIEAIRHWGSLRLLNRVWAEFVSEAFLTPGYLKTNPTFEQVMRAIEMIRWFWPGFKHVDPVKEANADHQHLEDGTTTLEDIYAEKGEDWKRKLLQRAKEAAYKKELRTQFDLTDAEFGAAAAAPAPAAQEKKDDDEDDDDDEKTPDPSDTDAE